MVGLLQCGQYFLSSILSGVFRLFFCVKYLDTPEERLLKLERHSRHSKVIKIRVPLFFAISNQAESYSPNKGSFNSFI